VVENIEMNPMEILRSVQACDMDQWMTLVNTKIIVKFEVFTAVTMKKAVFWDMANYMEPHPRRRHSSQKSMFELNNILETSLLTSKQAASKEMIDFIDYS
jgi:hypothetical protein